MYFHLLLCTLTTGFGKSLIFQLYALLIPRTTLIICPLKALIADQMMHLRRLGLVCAEAITSSDTKAQRENKRLAFASGKYRLLYIAPERLLTHSFHDELKRTITNTPVGAFVIDEAHCISEWGHDFRPAYMRIAGLRRDLQRESQRMIPLIALTATASPRVRDDILEVLDLPADGVVQLASSDRSNLSLSVHPVKHPNDKPKQLTQLISTNLPQALGTSFEQITDQRQNDEKSAFIVFGMYANPSGVNTRGEGVHTIAGVLETELFHTPGQVQVFSSKTPDCCPHCHKPGVVKEQNSYRCSMCRRTFTQPAESPQWEKTIQARQHHFLNDEFPVLVATKGFGMGIDKPNIRGVVHHALSSGIESYYQEAGRAGRDGKHAHIALMYQPPHPDCRSTAINNLEPPACVTGARKYHCPFYTKHLCDYGLQAQFIQGDYRGIDVDLVEIIDVYRQIESGKPIVARKVKDTSKHELLALHRLLQVGIIADYSINYQQTPIRYEVDYRSDWTIEQLTEALERLLSRFDDRSDHPRQEIQNIVAHAHGTTAELREQALSAALKALLTTIYKRVLTMRYQMLRNELTYAEDTQGKCRRIFLRSTFDVVDHLAKTDYRCGHCDVCVPDLLFSNTQATVVVQDMEADALAWRIDSLVSERHVYELADIVERAVALDIHFSLHVRMIKHLEVEPTNLVALYLAGACSYHIGQHPTESFNYIERGFQAAREQHATQETLELFFEQGFIIDSQRAFRWLTEVDGSWDSDVGLAFLEQRARTGFGATSVQYKTVHTRRMVRAYTQIVDQLLSLQNVSASMCDTFG